MKNPLLTRSPFVTSSLLFFLSVLTGWCVFNLQIISLVRLLQEVGIEVLPVLMVLQAGMSWVLLRLWGNSALDSSTKFFVSALGVGVATVVGAHLQFSNSEYVAHDARVFGAFFIFSQLAVSALRMGIHVIFSKQISVLRTPQISTQLAIAEESGFLTGVLLLMLTQIKLGHSSLIVSALPFVLAAAVVGVIRLRSPSAKTPLQDKIDPNREPGLFRRLKSLGEGVVKPLLSIHQPMASTMGGRKPPYLPWLIGLFSVVAFLKSIQWFGMAYGLAEASKQGAQIVYLFSKMALIQSIFTLTILAASLKFASKIPTWTVGFRVLLLAQGFANVALTFFPFPYALMSAEISRKVMEHGFLGRSLQLLTSAIPDEERLEVRHMLERWSTTSGTAIAGVVALVVIKGIVPIWLMCFACVLIAIFGMRLRRRLFATLCDFHIARLNQDRLQGVIQACYVLGNHECRQHHAALTGVLELSPRPAITKAVLNTLGRMTHPSAIGNIKAYLRSDREDIQLAAVRALHQFHGHEINLILLTLMRDLIRSEMALRFNVVKVLTERLGRLAIPYLLEVLENPAHDRVEANAVEILGEIAQSEHDEDLMDYLAKYLDSKYSRRVRANAIVTLYGHKKHAARALECFDRLLTSRNPKELDSFAYICGMLSLKGHESFIWQRSESLGHRDSTLLVALLRLGNPESASLLAEWTVGPNERLAYVALVRLSAVPVKQRSKVFYELIARSPQQLDLALLRMRASQRDFDADRDLIREEARRLGLSLMDEAAWVPTAELAQAAGSHGIHKIDSVGSQGESEADVPSVLPKKAG